MSESVILNILDVKTDPKLVSQFVDSIMSRKDNRLKIGVKDLDYKVIDWEKTPSEKQQYKKVVNIVLFNAADFSGFNFLRIKKIFKREIYQWYSNKGEKTLTLKNHKGENIYLRPVPKEYNLNIVVDNIESISSEKLVLVIKKLRLLLLQHKDLYKDSKIFIRSSFIEQHLNFYEDESITIEEIKNNEIIKKFWGRHKLPNSLRMFDEDYIKIIKEKINYQEWVDDIFYVRVSFHMEFLNRARRNKSAKNQLVPSVNQPSIRTLNNYDTMMNNIENKDLEIVQSNKIEPSIQMVDVLKVLKDTQNTVHEVRRISSNTLVTVDAVKKTVEKTYDIFTNGISDLLQEFQIMRNQKEKHPHFNNNELDNYDIIIEQYSDRVIKKVVSVVQSNYLRANEKQKIITKLHEWFGVHWYRLDETSQTLLVTSELVYDHMNNWEEGVDYSPAVVPLTKALERILYSFIVLPLRHECESRFGSNFEKWPQSITSFSSKKQYELKPMSLGNVIYIFKDREAIKILSDMRIFQELTEFIHDDLNENIKSMNEIREYRNQAAHKEGITIFSAEKCRNILLIDRRFFIKFLEALEV